MNILLIEDNTTIAKGLIYAFEKQNMSMKTIDSFQNAERYLSANVPDLVILDISLPDGNGFDLYAKHLHDRHIPTIFLTAKDTEDDIVKGLEMGAEDYITKPFSTRELIAKVNRILNKDIKHQIQIKDMMYDFDKMAVYLNHELVPLTSLELKILGILLNNRNHTVTRDTLLESIWQWTGNDVNENTVSVYLKRIRDKIGDDKIITVKGIGYRIDEEE